MNNIINNYEIIETNIINDEEQNILINKFYKILNKKVKIIGVGGVDSGRSAYNKIINGANLVQLYTGMIYQGPNIIKKIKTKRIPKNPMIIYSNINNSFSKS